MTAGIRELWSMLIAVPAQAHSAPPSPALLLHAGFRVRRNGAPPASPRSPDPDDNRSAPFCTREARTSGLNRRLFGNRRAHHPNRCRRAVFCPARNKPAQNPDSSLGSMRLISKRLKRSGERFATGSRHEDKEDKNSRPISLVRPLRSLARCSGRPSYTTGTQDPPEGRLSLDRSGSRACSCRWLRDTGRGETELAQASTERLQ